MLGARQLSVCPSSELAEAPIGVAALYLGGSILIESAINQHASVSPAGTLISHQRAHSSFLD